MNGAQAEREPCAGRKAKAQDAGVLSVWRRLVFSHKGHKDHRGIRGVGSQGLVLTGFTGLTGLRWEGRDCCRVAEAPRGGEDMV